MLGGSILVMVALLCVCEKAYEVASAASYWDCAIFSTQKRPPRLPSFIAQDHRAIESYKAHNDGVRRLIEADSLGRLGLLGLDDGAHLLVVDHGLD